MGRNFIHLAGSSRNSGKKFCFEARCLRQPCGDLRPRLLYLTLPASIVVRAFLEPLAFGQSSELAFRVGVALPIVSPNHVVSRPDCGKHPCFDALRRRAQDNPWRTFMLTKPVENHRSQDVGGFIRRRAGFFTRQVFARCISNTATGVRLARHVRIYMHDQHVVKRQCRRIGYRTAALADRLTAPTIDSDPSCARAAGRCRVESNGSLRLQRLKLEIRIRQQGSQDRLKHDGVGWSFDGGPRYATAQTSGTPPRCPITHSRDKDQPCSALSNRQSSTTTRSIEVRPETVLETVNNRTRSSCNGRPSRTNGLCVVSRIWRGSFESRYH